MELGRDACQRAASQIGFTDFVLLLPALKTWIFFGGGCGFRISHFSTLVPLRFHRIIAREQLLVPETLNFIRKTAIINKI